MKLSTSGEILATLCRTFSGGVVGINSEYHIVGILVAKYGWNTRVRIRTCTERRSCPGNAGLALSAHGQRGRERTQLKGELRDCSFGYLFC
jgi:hypothetical protein